MWRHASSPTPRGVFPVGTRVRVLEGLDWSSPATGTIAEPPPGIASWGNWQGWWRMVTTELGTFRSYWVVFDEPQFDSQDDGPYPESEVDERWIEPLPVAPS